MRTRLLSALLTAACLCFLSACAIQKRTLEIPLDTLQAQLTAPFPIEKHYEDLFDVTLSDPALSLDGQNGQIIIETKLVVHEPSSDKSWIGNLRISGTPIFAFEFRADLDMRHPWQGKDGYFYDLLQPNFDALFSPEAPTDETLRRSWLLHLIAQEVTYKRDGIFLYNPKIEEIQLQDFTNRYPEELNRLSSTIANQIRIDAPIYRFAEKDFLYFANPFKPKGFTFAPKKITVSKSKLTLRFEFWRPNTCGCWEDDNRLIEREDINLLPSNLGTPLYYRKKN